MKRAILYIVAITLVGVVFYITSVHQYTRLERIEGTVFSIPKEHCSCIGSLEVLITYLSPDIESEFKTYECTGIEWCQVPGE